MTRTEPEREAPRSRRGFPNAITAGLATSALMLLATAPVLAEEPGLTHTLTAEAGLGWDSNPFLAPDDPYFDQNSREVVHPVRQPGFFVPIRIDGGLVAPLGRRGHRFVTGYRAIGDYFTADASSSADQTWIRIEPGFVFELGFGSRRKREIDLRAFGSYNRELFFDRDTGLPAITSGFDISDRYNYRADGLDLNFVWEFTKQVRLYLEGRAEHRNYDDPDLVEAFDHDRVGGELGTLLRLASWARWTLFYAHQVQQFDERFARGLDGEDALGNPLLRYELSSFGTVLRFRPLQPWNLELSYEHGGRSDTYLGYNDYDETVWRLRSTVERGRTRWRLTLKQRERDFERAFIFDKPVDPSSGLLNPLKTFDTVDARFEGWFPLKGRLGLFGELRYTDEESTDPRFDYDRSQALLGVELEY